MAPAATFMMFLRKRFPSAHAAYRAPAPVCPTGAGSKVGLEVMPITTVTLSEGNSPGERSPSRRYERIPGVTVLPVVAHIMGASARVGWTAVIAQTGDDLLIGLAGSEQRLPAGGADGPIILIVAPRGAGTSAGAIDALKDNAKETVKAKAAYAKLGGLARKQVAWRAGGELQACCGRVPHLRLHARVGAAAAPRPGRAAAMIIALTRAPHLPRRGQIGPGVFDTVRLRKYARSGNVSPSSSSKSGTCQTAPAATG
jgi:hypothetical protein